MSSETKFFSSRKVQLTLLTTLMGIIPMCLAAAMVFLGKLDAHAWSELTWKLFLAGTGAPGTASVVMRGIEGAAARKHGPRPLESAPPTLETIPSPPAKEDSL